MLQTGMAHVIPSPLRSDSSPTCHPTTRPTPPTRCRTSMRSRGATLRCPCCLVTGLGLGLGQRTSRAPSTPTSQRIQPFDRRPPGPWCVRDLRGQMISSFAAAAHSPVLRGMRVRSVWVVFLCAYCSTSVLFVSTVYPRSKMLLRLSRFISCRPVCFAGFAGECPACPSPTCGGCSPAHHRSLSMS